MSSELLKIRQEDLVNNPTPRVPVCLCLDTSGSMSGDPIDELNEGVRQFYEAIRQDEAAFYSTEISIVTFGGTEKCIVDFASLELQPDAPVLSAGGLTPMGEAVNMSLDLLESRKKEYQEAGVDYYQPWLVLMTDGGPNGDANELTRAIERTVKLVNSKKLTIFPIGIGADADMQTLAQFSPKRLPLKLKGLRFNEFFAWLSKSIAKTSESTPGEKINLAPMTGWYEL